MGWFGWVITILGCAAILGLLGWALLKAFKGFLSGGG